MLLSKNPLSRIGQIACSNNQNAHRLTKLKPLEELNASAVETIKVLCGMTDRGQQAAGVLLYGLLSHGKSVAIISSNDLDKLIKGAAEALKIEVFTTRSLRGASIWSQATGFLLSNGFMKIIKPQRGAVPGVIEVIDPEWLGEGLLELATDEMRLMVINSTLKKKHKSYESYNANNTYEA